MLARGVGLFCILLCWLVGTGSGLAASSTLLHEASGLRFPESIEGRWRRESPAVSGKTAKAEYATSNGWRVRVEVRPAPKDARGPSLLDGDARSDASPEFRRALEADVKAMGKGMENPNTASSQRFKAAPQQQGPIGMKVTVNGGFQGQPFNRELLLFERNGILVSFAAEYPQRQWSGVGLSYTDVAHFVGWPSSKN